MPKCNGHIHTPEGKPKLCGTTLKEVGFIRGEDDEIETENYVCENAECSKYKDTQRFSVSKHQGWDS